MIVFLALDRTRSLLGKGKHALQEVASTTSLPDPSASITDSFPRVFKEFDFLEAEHDSVSETADSCFGWLSTMRPRSIGGDEPQHDDDADVDEDEVRLAALICFE
ncbi:hypothetical protein ANCDUO_20970 [Ancylostoma duodenale]|uniref:Uncharacterized protein n=1 Tax=Ancylostoma duodenale TaxID=51022 RepID=A0A0C2CGQ2_9BILA|nr:hypothetical protein ANCDUO_20970 [Ancylostoma duodenale]